MGTTGEDGRPEVPARTAVLQSPRNRACTKCGKAVSNSLTVLKYRLEVICFHNNHLVRFLDLIRRFKVGKIIRP